MRSLIKPNTFDFVIFYLSDGIGLQNKYSITWNELTMSIYHGHSRNIPKKANM